MVFLLLSFLASAIGRVAPRRAEQRHVIMRLWLGNRKAQRHDVEKRRIAYIHTARTEMSAHGKAQLVAADRQGTVGDQRRVGPPTGLRHGLAKPVSLFPREFEQPHLPTN